MADNTYCGEEGYAGNVPPPLPKAVRPDTDGENRGGYDCEFVEAPPKGLQTECSVCLLVLKEPCLISCCGQKFCKACIERVQKSEKPCPLCNAPGFTFLRDRGLESSLSEFDVSCSHTNDGCDWKGQLGELNKHLNKDASTENQANECQFVEVECAHECGEWFHRRNIGTHETNHCKKRPYSCDHCRDYHSTFEDVVEIHYPKCDKYPVACPNECQVYKFERQELENHLQDQCPLTLVECPFGYVGCKKRLPRKDVPKHVNESTHITLLATTTQALMKENQELQQKAIQSEEMSRKTVEEVQGALQTLHQKYDSVVAENQKLRTELQGHMEKVQESLQALRQKCDELVEENEQLDDRLTDEEESMEKVNASMQIFHNAVAAEHPPVFPVEIKVCKRAVQVRSFTCSTVTFYTHPHGYQMCVEVYPYGTVAGNGAHVSIFTHLMKGPFDEHLKWPFRGEVTIQIVNQAGDHDQKEITISYTDDTPESGAGRVTDKDRSVGWGKPQFLDHATLQNNTTENIQYLKDDHFIVRVVKVKVV